MIQNVAFQLSVQHNRLLRMFQVSKLSHLKILNLSHNCVVTMEGLRELKLLTWLSLASNSIKGIECLNHNVRLEHLDLSDNAIPAVADISHLKNLKVWLTFDVLVRLIQGVRQSTSILIPQFFPALFEISGLHSVCSKFGCVDLIAIIEHRDLWPYDSENTGESSNKLKKLIFWIPLQICRSVCRCQRFKYKEMLNDLEG